MALVQPGAQGIKVTDSLYNGVNKVAAKEAVTVFSQSKSSVTLATTDTVTTASKVTVTDDNNITLSSANFSGINEFVVGQ